MVLDFYNLKEQPFGVTPDPRYLYPSPTHREALASLAYGIQNGRGFMSIIATPGMGKTTILFQMLQQLESSARVAFLCQTLCRSEDIIRGVLHDLGVAEESTDAVRMEAQLNELLLAEARRGRKVVVVIDEAQNLDDSALEAVRLLSNFETSSDKLIQIILAGQPQLRERLASPRLLQLRQRMSIMARLQPFSAEETRLYIAHRLRIAGYDFNVPLFTPEAEALIARYSGGIPRNINNICFNALSLGCVLKQKTIQKGAIREVVNDLDLNGSVFREPGRESVERRLAAWVRNAGGMFQQPLVWRKWVAAATVLLLPLVLFGVRRGINVMGSVFLTAVSAASPTGTKNLASGSPAESSMTTVTAVNSEAKSSANGAIGTSQAISLTQMRKSRLRSNQYLASTDDPALLWAQVKKQNSNAEVELARMYLDGSVVPQNCQQAQVLLRAASRKGNRRAADLLSGQNSQCTDVPDSKGERP
jgi:type II secretory pathway predicted ATPase ExeA